MISSLCCGAEFYFKQDENRVTRLVCSWCGLSEQARREREREHFRVIEPRPDRPAITVTTQAAS